MNKFKAYYALRWQIFERDNFTCQYCGQYAPNVKLELDHVIPKEDGGTDDPDNLKTSCYACNRGKSGLRIQQDRKGKQRITISEATIAFGRFMVATQGKPFTIKEIVDATKLTDNYSRVLLNQYLKGEVAIRISPGVYRTNGLVRESSLFSRRYDKSFPYFGVADIPAVVLKGKAHYIFERA